jgi:hypothetical protein
MKRYYPSVSTSFILTHPNCVGSNKLAYRISMWQKMDSNLERVADYYD